MEASQITKLLQKQNTRYINRNQTVDSSTLIWKNQIQSSKYIKGVKTCDGEQNWNVPTNPACPVGNGICSFGGSGRTTAIQTGSPQQFLNVLSGATGSAAQVYSSESITMQRAGKESCGVAPTNPAPQNSYVVLPGGDPLTSNAQLQNPSCSYMCTNTNGPVNGVEPPINNNLNPYLPQFDTYYKFKNAICNYPVQDQNQKHFVKQCHSRFQTNTGENAVFNPDTNTTYLDPITKKFVTTPYLGTPWPDGSPNQIQPTCDGCIIEPPPPLPQSQPKPESQGIAQWATYLDGTVNDSVYSITRDSLNNVYITGYYNSTNPVTVNNAIGQGVSSIQLPASSNQAAYLIKYNATGIAQWATYLDGTGGDYGFYVSTDSLNNVYIYGYYKSTNPVTVNNAIGQGISSIQLPASSNQVAFLIKYNAIGIAQWATYLNAKYSSAESVTTDSLNNVYITGIYTSTNPVTVNNAIGQGVSSIQLPSTTDQASYLIKYNTSGIAQWATYLDGIPVYSYSVITDSLNNVYIAGLYSSINPVLINNAIGQGISSIQLPSTTIIVNYIGSAFLIKYNASGIAQWATYLDIKNDVDLLYIQLSVDSLNNVYVTGNYSSANPIVVNNAIGQGVSSIQIPSSLSRATYLIKYNASGIVQWATYLDGTGNDSATQVITDSLNNVYITGSYISSNLVQINNAIGQGVSSIQLPVSSIQAAFLIKYNASGIAQWATYLTGTGNIQGNAVIADSFNNVYFVGRYNSTNPVPINNAIGQGVSSIQLPVAPSQAAFLIKYS